MRQSKEIGRCATARLAICAFAAFLAAAGTTSAQWRPTIPASRLTGIVSPALAGATGRIEVVVKLADAPLAVAQGVSGKQRGLTMNRAQAQGYLASLGAKQDNVMGSILALGGTELARVSKSLNAVIVSIDASQLDAVASILGVVSVRPVLTYKHDLAETVPHIGAAAAQTAGKDGTGTSVAVLDSGIDYTHRNLGGPGTVADYGTCYAQKDVAPSGICANFFGPSAPKVIGGYDFVGELWTGGAGSPPRTEDPNPIDFGGHGTHVADIIAGLSADRSHKGVAPGAKLYAVKVCSAVSTSCNGVALLKGMDFALDPNGDGDISDAVDVVNMSLGSNYGQKEDDLSEASANAVRFGVVVVAAAGNAADRPYIVSSPSTTPEVISVAQTQVPSAKAIQLRINAPAAIAGLYPNTATVDWAPIGAGFTGDVAFVGRGCNADTYLANPSGKVALIDRGACNISEKVKRASTAGATGVLIGLVAAGDAVTFGNGGDCPAVPDGTCKPTLVIIQSNANLIKANLAAPVNVTVSNANALPLVGSMVGSSARGPSFSFNAIKPDIGAPGASVSAIARTGSGEEPFGGTSGATPMVAGSAAILLQAYPSRSPAEIKSLLMNTAETQVLTNPATLPGVLAPITRIGGGEVRVKRALDATAAAWDSETLTGSLSFGYWTITADQSFKRSVTVRNYANSTRTFSITPTFRYASDSASGAVSFKAPASVSVPTNGTATFDVQLRVAANRLPTWNLNGGSQGGNGALLQGVEFDGYLTLADATDTLNLAWHVLPHRADDIALSANKVAAGGSVTLTNSGARAGRVELFSLTGTSSKIQKFFMPQPGDNFAVVDLKSVGVRQAGSNIQFALNTFGERAHPSYPAEFDIYIDNNNDGIYDYVIFNLENGGFGVSGQNVVAVLKLKPNGTPDGAASIFFFTDADLNSSNAVLTAPLAALGMTAGTKFTFGAYAFDNYFTGNLTDFIEGMTYTAGTPRFIASGIPSTGVPAGGTSTLTVQAVAGGDAASPSQSGLLLLYRDGKLQNEAATLFVTP